MSVPRLVIRAAQMEAMSQAYRRSFVRRLVRHLRVDFPKQREGYGILEMDVEPLVEKGMAEAESYGLTSQDDVQLYLECMVVYGPGLIATAGIPGRPGSCNGMTSIPIPRPMNLPATWFSSGKSRADEGRYSLRHETSELRGHGSREQGGLGKVSQ
jgi:hypothetical protein